MPYNPKSVLRQVPNAILQKYFSRHDEFAAFDWAAIKETRIDPVFEAWQRMPEDRRKQASGVIRRVHALANPRGTAVLVEAASEEGIDIAAAVRSMKNAYERAFWFFLEHPAVFQSARTQFHIATLPRRSWEKRNGMPKQAVEINDGVLDALGSNLSAYYLARQVRGERCKVEYRRHAGIDTFYAYPADYGDDLLGYDDDGELGRSPWNPAFEVVFRYDGSAGTIESFAEGGKDVREDLAETLRSRGVARGASTDALGRAALRFECLEGQELHASPPIRWTTLSGCGGWESACDCRSSPAGKSLWMWTAAIPARQCTGFSTQRWTRRKSHFRRWTFSKPLCRPCSGGPAPGAETSLSRSAPVRGATLATARRKKSCGAT